MGRYTASKCKLCRRENNKLFLKGERCNTAKCAFEKRAYAPGAHGNTKMKPKETEYGMRLREKQKARRIYGINEKQFRKYFETAARKTGNTGELLLQLLERRIDNVLYRLSLCSSRQQARQWVRHGLVRLENKKVNVPSYQVKIGDQIILKDKYQDKVKKTREGMEEKVVPAWLVFDDAKLSGKVVSLPSRDDIEGGIQENFIVEFYSR
jgi:small subunit ribosomal protein S4